MDWKREKGEGVYPIVSWPGRKRGGGVYGTSRVLELSHIQIFATFPKLSKKGYTEVPK